MNSSLYTKKHPRYYVDYKQLTNIIAKVKKNHTE